MYIILLIQYLNPSLDLRSHFHVCYLQVLWVFLYVLYAEKYIAGATITLLVEINSTTLHARLLLKLAGAQASRLYHVNKLLNLFTYVAFRLVAQFYITYHVVRDYHWLDLGVYFLFTVILMDVMILIYFYRLLRADFFPRRKRHLEQNGTQHNSFSRLLDEWLIRNRPTELDWLLHYAYL